ncbi:hypothetical protein BpV2_125 [Bathycoccus sp. RCC1105 virus BpV2]|jgi:hypothetical protein|nr:hypothetical protein BpV2_125 [Bathycoccus sp. RCC1105 virus BpV2]
MRKYLYIASGVISTILVLKLLFRKPPPPSPDYSDLPPLEDPDESSSEENVTVKRTLTSRANTYQKDEIIKRPKLTHMLKDELIEECIRRNIAVIGTVRVLRERLRLAREEEKQA